MTHDSFRNRLDLMIDLRHPLAVLANRIPWQEIEASPARRWARQVKAGKKIWTCLARFRWSAVALSPTRGGRACPSG